MDHPHTLVVHLGVAALTSAATPQTETAGVVLGIIAVANAVAAVAVAWERIGTRRRHVRRKKQKPRRITR